MKFVDAFLLDRESAGLSWETVSFYERNLLPFFQHVGIAENDVSASDVRKYIVHLKIDGSCRLEYAYPIP